VKVSDGGRHRTLTDAAGSYWREPQARGGAVPCIEMRHLRKRMDTGVVRPAATTVSGSFAPARGALDLRLHRRRARLCLPAV